MPVFTPVAKDGVIVGYVLTKKIFSPSPPDGPPVEIPIVDNSGNPIGHVTPGGPVEVNR